MPFVTELLRDPVLMAAAYTLTGVLFLTAAWHKWREAERFQASLQAYKLLPAFLVVPAGWLLAVLETLVVAGLILPATRSSAMALAALLLFGYGLAMAINLLRGRSRIDCGCGDEAQMLAWPLVCRNALIGLWALASTAGAAERPFGVPDGLTALLCVAGFFGLYRVADELIRQAGHLKRLKEGS